MNLKLAGVKIKKYFLFYFLAAIWNLQGHD